MESADVPPGLEAVFAQAQAFVSRYFAARRSDPSSGSMDILGERFIFIRSAGLSVEFFDLITSVYEDPEEARQVAWNLLFDLAHALGRADARSFHERLKIEDAISKLSVGPVYFAYSGWAHVVFLEPSRLQGGDDFVLTYAHENSFEADAWIRSGKVSTAPVCAMNAGYSSGWVQQAFGRPLVSTELTCRARGDERCLFVLGPPERMPSLIAEVRGKEAEGVVPGVVEIPSFFSRKRMVDELREREEQYRSVFEGSMDGLAILSADGRVVAVNPSLCRIVGRRRDELEALRFEDLFEPGAAPSFEAFRGLVADTGRYVGEAESKRRAELRNLELIGSPIRYRGGAHVLATLRDVTERFCAERSLALLKSQLEGEVERRMAERRQREKRLMHAHRVAAVREFAEVVSQDLQSLHTVIRGHAERLKRGELAGVRKAEAIDEILSAVDRATDLRDRLRATGPERAGEPRVIDVVALLLRARPDLERLLDGQASLEVEARGHLASRLDPIHFELILNHLISNAREAGATRIRLRLSRASRLEGLLHSQPLPSSGILLEVSDDGAGMSAETRERAFEPFFSTRDSGLGLGLTTVAGLVQRQGGGIGLDSSPAGTRLSLFWPCTADPIEAPEAESTQHGGGELILLAEDDAAVRAMLEEVLVDAGYRVDAQPNGERALARGAELGTGLDLLLTDLTMPGVGGAELARRLRALQPGLAVVFMSGFLEQRLVGAGIPSDAGVLSKPFSLDELFGTLRRSLARRGQAGASAR